MDKGESLEASRIPKPRCAAPVAGPSPIEADKRYWPVALLKAAHLLSIRGEGVDDAPSEANFKTKASKQGPTGIGGRWIVIVTRKRRVRSP